MRDCFPESAKRCVLGPVQVTQTEGWGVCPEVAMICVMRHFLVIKGE